MYSSNEFDAGIELRLSTNLSTTIDDINTLKIMNINRVNVKDLPKRFGIFSIYLVSSGNKCLSHTSANIPQNSE